MEDLHPMPITKQLMADLNRFYQLRARLINCLETILHDPDGAGGYCKSYEGAMELHFDFPDVFVSEPLAAKPSVQIILHCYLLGPRRHYEWRGRTFAEALDRAECDMIRMINDAYIDIDREDLVIPMDDEE